MFMVKSSWSQNVSLLTFPCGVDFANVLILLLSFICFLFVTFQSIRVIRYSIINKLDFEQQSFLPWKCVNV